MTKVHKIKLIRIILAGAFFLGGEFLPLHEYFSLGLLLAAYAIAGYTAVFTALRNITKGQIFDENFLMTVATIGALALRQWDEAVAVMLFYLVGEFFESYAVDKSRNSISDLMDLMPEYAFVLRNGEEVKVDPYEVQVGETIIVKPGEKVPLDGLVTAGTSTLDTKALTGESLPREISVEEEIVSGFINITGLLKIKVTKAFENSTVAQILDLVENAGSKKANVEKFITKFAKYYTPIVVISAVIMAVVPPLITGDSFSDWVYRSLLFLVISCPCALVISVPLSFFAGVGASSKLGVLVKGSSYLESLAHVDTVIFDKTGTLTTGEFTVSRADGPEDLLRLAAHGEIYSNHPIALSIKKAYKGELDKNLVKDIEDFSGMGVCATVADKIVHIGNERLMTSLNINQLPKDETSTVLYVAVNKEYYGAIYVSDTIKDDALLAIQKLKALGITNTVMLTGDKKAVADKVAKTLGITTVKSQLLPGEKVTAAEEIIENAKGKVVFVGDGINDAPVLARADIGVAMGGLGQQAAIEAADVVILEDAPSKLPSIIKVARKTSIIAKENVIFALGVKGVILLLGAIGFATMSMAIFADVGVSIIAILNAMRTLLTARREK